jgi:predicted ATPase/DNA-binding SARP family transcriptional activator
VPDSAWRQKRAAAILKLLALEPSHRLHREQLLDTLWPELDPEAAANNLRGTLHHARRQLEAAGAPKDAFLVRDGDLLRLGPEGRVAVDLDAFEAAAKAAWRTPDPDLAERAVAAYGGDLLPEDPYEEWAADRREGLRASYLALLARLAQLAERAGERDRAIGALRRLVEVEPAQEEAHAALIRLLAEAGQRAQALAQYERLVAVLERELGAEPDRATRELVRAVREGRVAPAEPASAREAPFVALPAPVDALVGRERELAEVAQLLATGRLLTLTGPGGIGKTRLALAVGHRLLAGFPDGAAFVDLTAIRDPDLVLPAVAQALGMRDQSALSVAERVVTRLRDKRFLLVLDNFEQVVAGAPAVAELLTACPGLRVLITSRVRLRLRGERVYPVPPLGLPDTEHLPALESLSQYAAVTLFIERALEARPGFAVTNATAPAVAAICARLDGLPLAIELAAARVRTLPPPELLARLDRPLYLLTEGARDLPERQRTIRGTISWSHDLLRPEEQVLFRRLAVFAGGWTLDAAEAVAGGETDRRTDGQTDSGLPSHRLTAFPSVVEGLAALVDHSLVTVREDAAGAARYGMLETIREFAAEQLEASGEAEAIRAAHAGHYRALGEEAGPLIYGHPVEFLRRVEVEMGNLRAAIAWAEGAGEPETGILLAHALMVEKTDLSQARSWLERLLAGTSKTSPATRLMGLVDLGWAALLQGDRAAAKTVAQSAAALDDAEIGPLEQASVLDMRALVALNTDGPEQARPLLEAALDRCRDTPVGERMTIWVLNHLGLVEDVAGNPSAALARYEEALALVAPGDDALRLLTLGNMTPPLETLGDRRRAAELERENLALLRRAPTAYLYLVMYGLWAAADHAAHGDDHVQAARLLGAAERVKQQAGFAAVFDADDVIDALSAKVRAALGEERYAAAHADGRALSLDAALGEAEAAAAAAVAREDEANR